MDPRDPFHSFRPFGVDGDLVRRVLAEATRDGCDDADVFFEHSVSTSVGLSDRAVNRAHTSIDLGAGVRVVVGDQVGYAYSEDLSPEALLRCAATARAIARTATPAPVGSTWQVASVRDLHPTQRRWDDVELDVRIPTVRRWEQDAFARDPRVRKVQCSLGDEEQLVLIARADGTVAADRRPMTWGTLQVTVEDDGGKRETGSYNVAGRADLAFYDEARHRRLVSEAVDRGLRALVASSPPAGEMPVVLGAGGSGVLLHEAIGHGMEADFNRKDLSIYATKLGQRIAPPGVTVIDSALLPNARGALNVDDEGSPTEETVLVRDGILEGYLHDRISARHYGVRSTGSGRRESFRSTVLPRMRCTYLQPGPTPPEEIVRGVKRGLYAEVLGGGQVRIGAGDFSFFVRQGWLIEDGKLTQPVKDANLTGNGPDVLRSIEAVGTDLVIDEGGWTCGKDGQSVPVSQGLPTVLVGRLSVGGGRP
jgi:TldD protein